MTEQERIELIHKEVQKAVARAGGNWKQVFRDEVMEIVKLFERKP